MSGAAEHLYTEARRALLDLLAALAEQRDAVVLVGAQAIYMHVGEGDLPVAPYTKDADFALDPRLLQDHPLLVQALRDNGFLPSAQQGMVGTWVGAGEIPVPIDLLVPDAHEPLGNRAAKLGLHGDRTARRARGLEGALVDRDMRLVRSLEPADARAIEAWVAGPAALLVSKLIKIAERRATPLRLNNKDALDVYRLLRLPVEEVRDRFRLLRADPLAGPTTEEALAFLAEAFTSPDGLGVTMVVQAIAGLADEEQVAQGCAILAEELLDAVRGA